MGYLRRLLEEIRRLPWEFLVNTVAASRLTVPQLRRWLYRAAGIDVRTQKVRAGTIIRTRLLTVGSGAFINEGCRIYNRAQVTIGERCNVGMGVSFITETHDPGDGQRRAGRETAAPIMVGDGTWIGANVAILPGVQVGDGCVIAAGAVVTGDCKPHSVYGGVPARFIRGC